MGHRTLDILSTLGPGWVLSRLLYTARQRSGWVRWRLPSRPWRDTPSTTIADFTAPWPRHAFPGPNDRAVHAADAILAGRLTHFHHQEMPGRFPPDWFRDPYAAEATVPDLRHWSLISDFGGGDIKGVWEANRFGLAFTLARAFAATGHGRYAEAFWQAVADWRARNPPQCGPNWKCGQEIALRLMAWVFGFHAVRGDSSSTPERVAMLAEMIRVSAARIDANIGYALSQRNNHGISEATGLLTAGIVLGCATWTGQGQRLLERQARELIYDDGSFSQHSANYHRVLLDDLLWAGTLAQANGVGFSAGFTHRLREAGHWLLAMLDPGTGRVPNLGPNDGALILPLTDGDYLDYRPTLQAVGCLVDGRPWLPAGPWDELAHWLGLGAAVTARGTPRRNDASPRTSGECGRHPTSWDRSAAPSKARAFLDGGYVVLSHRGGQAVFRCPHTFRHRPSHCDLLHVDLWHGGANLLRDGGSYSYNCEPPWQEYFRGTSGHNTIQFDDYDQMPKLTRFLYGRWPTLQVQAGLDAEWPWACAQYRDWLGCQHCRRVEHMPDGYRVTDKVQGFRESAVLRWRLAPELDWTRVGDAWTCTACTIRISASPGPLHLAQVTGWESLYYLQKTELPVIEATVTAGPQTLTTEITLDGPLGDL